MFKSRRTQRGLAVGLVAMLAIASCGGDDDGGGDATDAPAETEASDDEMTEDTEASDDESTEDTEAAAETEASDDEMTEDTEATDEGDGGDAESGEELALEGEVEVAAGTTLNLDECPDDWDPFLGVDGDEIRLGQSLPLSGPAAAFGPIADGMQAYFDYLNDNDPIADKELVLVAQDDAYEAGRTVANVQEMLDTEDIFAFIYMVGTPNNLAIRDTTAEACVPQLFNSSGFPLWGDPTNYPWTIGGLLNYETETQIWCQNIVEDVGEGATVAALVANNDFGKTYQTELEQCAADGQIDLVDVQLHDPVAPDVTNEMTTLAASGADVFVAGTTGAYCPQTVGIVAATEWRPTFYMSYTCNNLAAFFAPVQEQAAQLAEEGSGVRFTNSNKICGDPAYDDDPAIQLVVEVLDEYASGGCEAGSYSTGVLFGTIIEGVLRTAADMPGGLNRVNLMAAIWNMDDTNDLLLGGTLVTDGVNDAYTSEAAEIQEVVVVDGELTFNSLSEIIDLEGEGGSFSGG